MHSLACNHVLVDGNKRLALLATVVFLRISGYVLDLTDDEAFDLTMSVAAGQLDADGIRGGFDPRQPLRDLQIPAFSLG
jgi:death on curing protein